MSKVIKILNTTDGITWANAAQLNDTECTCKVIRKLNSYWTIEINYIIPPAGQGINKSDYITDKNAKARVYNTCDSSDYQTFLLSKTTQSKSAFGGLTILATGDHISIGVLSNKIVNTVYDFQSVTPQYALDTLIANHSFGYARGTIEPTALISVYISWESVMGALQKLLTACGGEYDIDEINGEIDIYSAMGSTAKFIHIRPERNLKSLSVMRYNRDVINKIYGIGAGNPPATIAGARHVVYSVVSQVVTVDHNKLVPENDSWNGYKVKFATGTLAGSSFSIADCAHGTVRDTVTLTGSIESVVAGDKIIITDSSGVEVSFVRAGASITSNGTIEDVYQTSKYSNAVNLVKTAFMDGAYTAGLCADWTKVGTCTLSENTNQTYIQYGAKSQKIVGGANGAGISQLVSGLTANKFYRIKINLYLEASSPVSSIVVTSDDVLIFELQESDTSVGQWILLDDYFQIGATSRTIKIAQYGAQAATYYIDAVQVSECPIDEPQNFTPNCEQVDLWKETFDQVVLKKDPVIEYKCNFVDLNKTDPTSYPFEEIALGDSVLITDEDLSLDRVSARIKEITCDPFRPEFTEHIVSNV